MKRGSLKFSGPFIEAWFTLEFGTRVYDWIGPSEEPHFMSTFALALVVDSLIVELRGPLALIVRGCVYGFGSAEVRGDRGGGAPTESEAGPGTRPH